jgi:hypothetical protein
MTNQWVGKYKKLKTDLENKAIHVKNMPNVSEDDLKAIQQSYSQTSKMLDAWLDLFIASLSTNPNACLEQLSQGDIPQDLKVELQKIFTFYANDFSTRFEDITGSTANAIEGPRDIQPQAVEVRFGSHPPIDKNTLLARFKTPLSPADWNTLY